MTMNVLAAVLRHIRKSSLQPVHTRQASTSSNPYPYPLKANPSPNEIFHLPHGASRNDVKTRYYDLVRIYHPDSPASRSVPSETAHARFQAISSAYAVLSGKPRAARHPGNDTPSFTKRSYNDINAAMRKARHRRRAELDLGFDDRWKDRMMLGAVLLAVGAFCFQTFSARRQAMSEAAERFRRPHPEAPISTDRTSLQSLSPEDNALAAPPPDSGKPNS